MTTFQMLGLDKLVTLFRTVRSHGGVMKTLYKMWRFDTLKEGKLVGWDCFGNRYYENNYYMLARNRWVEYADSVAWEYDATQITAEWYGWIHHKTDRVPCDDCAKAELMCCPYTAMWLMPHEENNSGTDRAYYPYSTTPARIYVWDGSSLRSRCMNVGV